MEISLKNILKKNLILLLAFLFFSCGTTNIENPESSEPSGPVTETPTSKPGVKPSNPVVQSNKILGFGYIEISISNYNYNPSLNKTYKDNISIYYKDGEGREKVVKSTGTGFFYIPDLERYTTYEITKLVFSPDERYPDSKWTYNYHPSFSFTYEDVGNIGDITVRWDCTGYSNAYIYKNESGKWEKAISLYESYFGKKYSRPVYKAPFSYSVAESYKTAKPDSRMKQIAESPDYQNLKKRNPELYIKNVCNIINQNSENDFERVKLAHDIICLIMTYDDQSYWSGRYPSQDFETALKSGKSVCSGFANVFKKFCDELKIPCDVVMGYTKGVGFNPNATTFNNNHDWNVVRIDGFWYLVDCTWDEGFMDGRTSVKSYNTNYLFARPEKMIYSHYPEKSEYQLLNKKFTSKDIIFVPNLTPEFFDGRYGFTASVDSLDSSKGTMTINFYHDNMVEITPELIDNRGYSKNEYITYSPTSTGSKLIVNITSKGLYNLRLKTYNKKERVIWPLSNQYYFNLY